MMKSWVLHTKEGNKVITEDEAIRNAKEQERAGVNASYYWLDYKTGKKEGSAGWLIWSTWEDGAGVCFRRSDGKYYIVTGWQADFCM